MIYQNNEKVSGIYYGIRNTYGKIITSIHNGANLIWEMVSSCFGGGYWNKDYTWNSDDAWKND